MSSTETSPLRQNIQMALVLVLISVSIGMPVWYVVEVGVTSEDEFVQTVVTGSWVLTIAGAGAAFSYFGLGRKVS